MDPKITPGSIGSTPIDEGLHVTCETKAEQGADEEAGHRKSHPLPLPQDHFYCNIRGRPQRHPNPDPAPSMPD
jgi:hypothetical protein